MKAEPLHSQSVTVTALPSGGVSPGQRPRRPEGNRDDALPVGARLGEFEILGVLGAGGFGIVYLAMDHTLRRTVAVKEHLPLDYARRSDDWNVVPRTDADAPTHAAGLQSFMREAQLLAGFDHPSLVKVHRFWKANGTAYMVMTHYPGRTLKEVQRTTGALRDEQSLRKLLHPLLCALELLHEAHVYHRDISPDNIVALPDGKPILLDFGSARHVVNDRTQALTAMFKPSFAAIEQYGDVPGLRQGAWTDLYALAGVMHFMITGSGPVPAALRAVNDAQPRLALSPAAGVFSMHLLQAIDWALAVRPDQRPQSVKAFREVLDGVAAAPVYAGDAVERAPATAATTAWPDAAGSAEPPARDRRVVRRTVALGAVSLALCAVIWSRHEPVTASPASAILPATVSRMETPASEGRGGAPAPAVRAPALAKIDPVSSPGDATAYAAPRKDATGPRPPPARATTSPSPKLASTGGGSGPRDACGDRNFVSMASCMDRQCREPAFQAHAQCEPFRRYAEARRQAELGR